MNILKLQDMLKGLPDARLQQELDNPTGTVPQYLVLSEVVRRQKMREEFAPTQAPQTTVLDDAKASLAPRPPMPQVGLPASPVGVPAMADGGFVSPSEAFGNAGFGGFPQQQQQKPQPPMGSLAGPVNLSPQTMAPQQSYQPQQQPTSQAAGPMVQLQQYGQLAPPQDQNQTPDKQQSFARGGAVRMGDGEDVSRYIEATGGGSLGKVDRNDVHGIAGGAGGRMGINIPALEGMIRAGLLGDVSGYNLKTPGGKLSSVDPRISGGDLSYSKDGRDYGVQYQESVTPQGKSDKSLMFNYAMPFAEGGPVYLADGTLPFDLLGKLEGFAKNPLSSAFGYGQFTNDTWMDYIKAKHPDLLNQMSKDEILALRTNPSFGKEANDWNQNERTGPALEKAGIPVNAQTLYTAHFAGPRGAVDLYKADPNTPVEAVLGSKVVEANPNLRGKTAGDAIAWLEGKVKTGNERVGNPADAAAGIGNAGQGSFPGGKSTAPVSVAPDREPKSKLSNFVSDVGLALMNQQPNYAPNAGMLRGASPKAAASYGQREQSIIDAYKKQAELEAMQGGIPTFFGTGIMSLASGGPVYLANGTPEGLTPEQELELISKMTPEQLRAYRAEKYLKSDAFKKWKQGVQGVNDMLGGTAADADRTTAPDRSGLPTPEEAAAAKIQFATGPLSGLMTDEQIIAASQAAIDSADKAGVGGKGDRLTPSTSALLGSASERLPPLMAGTNYTPPATPAAAPPKEPTELELYNQYMKQALGLQKDFIDEQRRAAEEANQGGFGQFLRRLGIGILASPSGRIQDAIASGVRNVATAGEAQKQQYQDQMDKIRQAELQYGLESAKLPYEIAKLTREGSGAPSASEIRKFYADQLSDLIKQKTEILKNPDPINGVNTSYIDSQITAIQNMLQQYGIPTAAMPVSPSDWAAASAPPK